MLLKELLNLYYFQKAVFVKPIQAGLNFSWLRPQTFLFRRLFMAKVAVSSQIRRDGKFFCWNFRYLFLLFGVLSMGPWRECKDCTWPILSKWRLASLASNSWRATVFLWALTSPIWLWFRLNSPTVEVSQGIKVWTHACILFLVVLVLNLKVLFLIRRIWLDYIFIKRARNSRCLRA